MIQDIAPKKFYNPIRFDTITAKDKVVLFDERSVLIQRNDQNELIIPSFCELKEQKEEKFQYAFSIDQTRYFIKKAEYMQEKEQVEGYGYEALSTIRQLISKEICFAVMSAWHLAGWYRDNRFCGRCATTTIHSQKERMLYCPGCGNMIYPKIAPAVIIGVVDRDRLLLSKYAGREYKKYALLAGFTEFGETAEETVAREVFEEVGLHIGKPKYYKSQPWGIDSNILYGFFVSLKGEAKISLDPNELSLAEWHERGKIPAADDGISLTREMIGFFEDKERFETWFFD